MVVSKPNRKQRLQMKALQTKKLRRKLMNSGVAEDDISNDMVMKSKVAGGINRLKELLPISSHFRQVLSPKLEKWRMVGPMPYNLSNNRIPWLTPGCCSSIITLSEELYHFQHFVELRKEEIAIRNFVISDVSQAVSFKWPTAEVRLFGSFQTDLCTYLSDLDITIIQSGRAINNMKEVEHVLPQSSGMSSLPESESTSWFIDTKGENNNDSDNSKIKTSVSTSEIVDLTSQSRKANANDSIGEQSSHETSDVNTYYSDSGDSDIESEYSGDGSEDDMSINVIRNTKRLTDANSPHRASVTKLTATDIKNKAKKTLGQLDDLYRHLRRFGYVTKAEFRKRAKVPIISFTHMSGVVCDISLDVTNDTTDAVQSMLHQGKHPEAFRAVTYFLKAFLSQLGLDSPFNGGIGSFKLYAMVAHVLRRFPLSNTNSKCRTCPGCSIKYHSSDAGALLLSFLKYYSHETNVNINTEFVECGVTINFLSTRLIDKCRYYFKMAYNVLCTNDMQQHNTHKYSILWKILPNAHTFALDREMTYRTCCSHMSDYSEGRREEIAVSILNDMQRRLQTEYTNTTLSFDQIKVSDPCFAHQLMSHNSVRSAVGHLGHMNSTQPLAIKSKIKRDENRNNNNKVYKDDDDGFAVSAAIAAGARTKHNAKQQQLKRKLHQTEKNNSAKILRRENIAKPKANSGRVVEVGLTKKPQFKKLLKNNFPKWKKQKS